MRTPNIRFDVINITKKEGNIAMIHVALIGCGNISPAHINGYLTFPERCKIVAFVDIYPEKATKRAEEYAPDAEVLDSHKKLLGRNDIDLISVCTPPYTHADIACDFLLEGKNVIVEKPMASSLAECDRIIEAQKIGGGTLSVVAQNRFRNPIMHLKQTLDTGLIGRVLHYQVDSHWWRGHCYYDLWWRGSWEKEGGGCTLNHAVHHIDMLNWMMGLPERVTAVMSNVAHDNAEVEDVSVAILEYEKGSLAQVTSSVVHHGEDQNIIIQGEKAKIMAPWDVYASISLPNGFPERNQILEKEIQGYYDSLPAITYEGHTGEIDNVMKAIETGSEVLIKGIDGRKTVELITAIYKAGCTRTTVTLPLTPEDDFYTAEGIKKKAIYFYKKGTSIENFEDIAITTGSNYQ